MSQEHPRSDASTGLVISWVIALILAPLALMWCVAEGVRQHAKVRGRR